MDVLVLGSIILVRRQTLGADPRPDLVICGNLNLLSTYSTQTSSFPGFAAVETLQREQNLTSLAP
jgi:hypothetical protein